MCRLSCALVLVAALLPGVTSRAQEPPQARIDELVRQYFAADSEEVRRQTALTLGQTEGVTFPLVEDAIRRGVFYTEQPTGVFTRQITVELDGSQTDCTFWVPGNYDPGKAWPLLVAMHGTRGNGGGFINRWVPFARDRGIIVIAPTAVNGVDPVSDKPFGKDHGYGANEIERSVPVSAVNAARRLYHIDSDRVYITGVSQGGHAAWDSALTHSDVFAGGIPEAGVPMVEGFQLAKYLFLKNLFQTRLWVMQGTPDKDQPQVNAEATTRLRALGYQVEYRQYEGKGHGAYPEESEAALDFILAGRRNVYAPRVVKIINHAGDGRACWVRIDKIAGPEWDPRKRIDVHVSGPMSQSEFREKVEKQVLDQLASIEAELLPDKTLRINTKKVSRITVFLHDGMVDMDKPIVVRLNGRQYLRSVRRDMDFMLEETRREFDTGRIFYGTLTLDVR